MDIENIKLNTYRLLSLFYANKEISRMSDPDDPNDPAARLERAFFAREMTQLLLSIAIGLRVLDDQMNHAKASNEMRELYFQKREKINKRHHCMLFDDMSLREVCNNPLARKDQRLSPSNGSICQALYALVARTTASNGGTYWRFRCSWMLWSSYLKQMANISIKPMCPARSLCRALGGEDSIVTAPDNVA